MPDEKEKRMGFMDYYDRQGRPISRNEYHQLRMRDDDSYKRIAEDTIGDVWVSTVWLGMDHQLAEDGPPLIFETLTFGDIDEIGDRYSTEAEALEGHRRICEEVRNGKLG